MDHFPDVQSRIPAFEIYFLKEDASLVLEILALLMISSQLLEHHFLLL
eukprot:CAMPEP_0203657292 /NCGR_PEP_ID=MMETSP0088-20131115/44334_1 /ASSEMBLY_ACC=CAM_ASM_001087 /TAXON_ID=426623 /ORGANISM="Chaetoceros affinis, Strain CCMP159" /LENGTH=47 /DNA_ID= /DNA_START= /DNA_END= /DNA_ORIENTATION=